MSTNLGRTVRRALATVLLTGLLALPVAVLPAGPAAAQEDVGFCPGCHVYGTDWFTFEPERAERRVGGDSFPLLILRGPDDPVDAGVGGSGAGTAPPGGGGGAVASGGAAAAGASCTPVPPTGPLPDWSAAGLPTGTVTADPAARGLTGLESRFSWSGPATVTWTQVGQPGRTADCGVIPAPAVTFTAEAVRLRWDLGERAATVAPAETTAHTFERRAPDGAVSVDVVWSVRGVSPPVTTTAPGGTRPYPVVEARAVLVD